MDPMFQAKRCEAGFTPAQLMDVCTVQSSGGVGFVSWRWMVGWLDGWVGCHMSPPYCIEKLNMFKAGCLVRCQGFDA